MVTAIRYKTKLLFTALLLVSSLFNNLLSQDKSIEYVPSYNEIDLNIKSILLYLQHEVKDCKDTCYVEVSGIVDYFDDCWMKSDSAYVSTIGFDKEKEFRIFPNSFIIQGFGEVAFVNPKNDVDFKFSPILFDKDRKTILGQVLKEDGSKDYYAINVLGNEFYLKYVMEYYYTCTWWH